MDTHRLTSDAGAKAAEPDLYECKIVEESAGPRCELEDLTPSEGGESADVLGNVLGASGNGRHVYFVAKGALGEGEEARNGICPQASEGECVNLYEYDTASRTAGEARGGALEPR